MMPLWFAFLSGAFDVPLLPLRAVARWWAEPRDDRRVEARAASVAAAMPRPGSGIDAHLVAPVTSAPYAFDPMSDSWLPASSLPRQTRRRAASADELRVLTWNCLMDKYEQFVPGVIRSDKRYPHIARKLADRFVPPLDLVCLNEVDAGLLRALGANALIREHYLLSEQPDLDDGDFNLFRRRSFGNVMLVRKDAPLRWRGTHAVVTSSLGGRRSLVCEFDVMRNVGGDFDTRVPAHERTKRLAVAAVHLDSRASVGHFHNRAQQLGELFAYLGTPSSAPAASPNRARLACDQALVMGDFNFHNEAESALIRAPYSDVWTQVHGNNLEPTWSGKTNALTRRMWLGVDQREMRLDRVALSDDGPLTPASIRVACKDIVPGLSICASDHYALHQIFKIEPVNND